MIEFHAKHTPLLTEKGLKIIIQNIPGNKKIKDENEKYQNSKLEFDIMGLLE